MAALRLVVQQAPRTPTWRLPRSRVQASSLPRYGIQPADPSTPEVSKPVDRQWRKPKQRANEDTSTPAERGQAGKSAANFSKESANSRTISARVRRSNGSA